MPDRPTRGRDISAALRSWRAALGLSQSSAAALLRVPTPTLQGWEAGRRCVLPDVVLLLMECLAQRQPAPAP